MKTFLAGLGCGLGVGLLVAPQDGSKTRQMIAERARNIFNRFGNGQKRVPYSTGQIADDEAVADVLNTASKHELMSVEGIGKGTANRIINNRPYETSTEVVQVGVLPE